ncbi:tumor necrosis factor ligand superfamily member 11 [Rhinophrynus dorsalis]
MVPGGYLRGAAGISVAQERPYRSHSVPRSVLLALVFLAVAQVGCTLGLFLYFKAQEVRGALSEKRFQVGNAIIEATGKQRNSSWPVAHLTIANHTNSEHQKVNLTSWNYKEGWANIKHMNYSNGKLKILQDGYYFVYANICFRHHIFTGKTYREKFLQLMMYICKSNMKRIETLMKGGNTDFWSNNSVYHFYSVYQGGVFKLLAGEEIFIQASYSALLDPAQEATYFGAFKILDLEL